MKHKKLRNGYGSIKFLGKSRSCPYGVYAPAVFDEDGKPHQKPLGYVRTWEELRESIELIRVPNW